VRPEESCQYLVGCDHQRIIFDIQIKNKKEYFIRFNPEGNGDCHSNSAQDRKTM